MNVVTTFTGVVSEGLDGFMFQVKIKNNNFFLSLPQFDTGSTCSIFFLILATTNHFWSRMPLQWGRICWLFHGQNWHDSDDSQTYNCVHTVMPFESVIKLCYSLNPYVFHKCGHDLPPPSSTVEVEAIQFLVSILLVVPVKLICTYEIL